MNNLQDKVSEARFRIKRAIEGGASDPIDDTVDDIVDLVVLPALVDLLKVEAELFYWKCEAGSRAARGKGGKDGIE